jgi:hypothetical protein
VLTLILTVIKYPEAAIPLIAISLIQHFFEAPEELPLTFDQ